jgi:hypothetical protein
VLQKASRPAPNGTSKHEPHPKCAQTCRYRLQPVWSSAARLLRHVRATIRLTPYIPFPTLNESKQAETSGPRPSPRPTCLSRIGFTSLRGATCYRAILSLVLSP